MLHLSPNFLFKGTFQIYLKIYVYM